MTEIEFEPRLQPPFSILVCGPSSSGKTYFVKNVLLNHHHVIKNMPQNIVWIYTSMQPMYDELKKLNKDIKFVKDLPESFDDHRLFPQDQSHLIILDDLIFQASDHPEVVRIFTQYRHHRNMSVILLSQNIFHQGKYSRAISLNSTHMILFKNPRDKLQVSVLANQILPTKKKYFLEAFEDATRPPHGYLIIDLTPNCPEHYRLRSGILPNQWPVVYLPK